MSTFAESMTTADHDMVTAIEGENRAMHMRNLADYALPSPWGPMLMRAGPAPPPGPLSSVTEETMLDDWLSDIVIEDLLAEDKAKVSAPPSDKVLGKRPAVPPSTDAKKAKRGEKLDPKASERQRIKVQRVCFTSYCIDPRWPGLAADFAAKECNFFICQPEKTKTVHVNDEDILVNRAHTQGYFELKRRFDIGTVKALLGGALDNPHLEAALGSAEQNIVYCTKTGPHGRDEDRPDFVLRIGDPAKKEPGRRTDLDRIANEIVNGVTPAQLAVLEPGMFVRYGKGLKDLSLVLAKPRVPKFDLEGNFMSNEVCVYFGGSGTGKSVKAYNENDPSITYRWTPANGVWFDLLKPEQTTMIVDEFRGQWPMGMLLAMLDSFPMIVGVKGGHVQLPTTKFVFTSPMHPKFWYQNQATDKIKQLLRRITTLTYFPTDGEEYSDPPMMGGAGSSTDPYNAQFN